MAIFNPLQIPERIRVRALFVQNKDLANAIKLITQEAVSVDDIRKAKKSLTKKQVYDYIEKNGLPQELLEMDQENPEGDGYHLRVEGNKYLFFYSERGSKTDVKVFYDWDTLCRAVVDAYFDLQY